MGKGGERKAEFSVLRSPPIPLSWASICLFPVLEFDPYPRRFLPLAHVSFFVLRQNGELLSERIYTTPLERYRCGAEYEGGRKDKFDDSIDFRSCGPQLFNHKVKLPLLPSQIPLGADATAAKDIASGAGNADLCAVLTPKYIPALPQDPSNNAADITDCTVAYNTHYQIWADSTTKRVTVSAPKYEAATALIQVSR